jgi:mRNA interferase RelE/StbE
LPEQAPEYRVSIARKAQKQLARFPASAQGRLEAAIMDLAHDPRPRRKSRKLSGSEDEWRLRVGDYRAVYAVDDEGREVVVLEVFHRQRGYG